MWFSGYEKDARWLRLTKSGAGLRCVPAGFRVARPTLEEFQPTFDDVLADSSLVAFDAKESLVKIAKATDEENGPDSEDRIEVGARLLTRLLEAGL